MEPVSLVLAGGALAVFYADFVSRREDENHRRILPPTLPETMDVRNADDSSSVLVIAVNVQRVKLVSRFAGERLKVRVKYGAAGHSIHCDTAVEEAKWPETTHFVAHVSSMRNREHNEQPAAEYGMTCLFLSSDQLKPIIRLRLIRQGRLGMESVMAKAELRMPLADSGMHKMELLLEEESVFCTRNHIGRLEVGVEVQSVAKHRLRDYLKILDAQTQKEAFLLATPVIEGKVETMDVPVRETPVAQGQALPATFCESRFQQQGNVH